MDGFHLSHQSDNSADSALVTAVQKLLERRGINTFLDLNTVRSGYR